MCFYLWTLQGNKVGERDGFLSTQSLLSGKGLHGCGCSLHGNFGSLRSRPLREPISSEKWRIICVEFKFLFYNCSLQPHNHSSNYPGNLEHCLSWPLRNLLSNQETQSQVGEGYRSSGSFPVAGRPQMAMSLPHSTHIPWNPLPRCVTSVIRSHVSVMCILLQTLPLAGFHRIAAMVGGGGAAWQTASKALSPSANTLEIWLLPTTTRAWTWTCPRQASWWDSIPSTLTWSWNPPVVPGLLIHRNVR